LRSDVPGRRRLPRIAPADRSGGADAVQPVAEAGALKPAPSTPRRILVAGATGSVGRAVALQLAARGDRLALAARDLEECERIAADCRVRHGVEAVALPFDAEGPGSPGAALVDQAA